MKFKLLKLFNIKKTVAVTTSVCFLFTMVFSQGLSAAITPAPVPAINQKTFKSIEDYLLPFSVGRITDALYTGGDEIIINIQDLHSHAQAQRNISNILSILDKKYGLKNVYVEGGIGQVDTTWLTSIADEKLKETILNNMLESGRLTGGEYYSAETNKNKLLLGIEDKTTYINNLKRLNEIYSKKQEILKYISFLKYTLNEISKKYYSRDNLKLNRVISKHKEGKLSAEKYFTYLLETAQKANVNLRKYPSIVAFLQVLKKQDGLDTKKVNLAIAELLNDLKSQLPYDQYQALLAKVSDKNKETEFYFDLYKVAKEKGLLEKSDYRTLLLFFEYLSLNQNLNPVNLTLEENSLLQELNVKLSQNQNEKDIYFLHNYIEYFSGYLTNKLTADEYEYFINNMARFKLLWKKYVDINGIIELDSYLNLFNDFYQDNVERNRFFIKNIIGQMPNQPKEGIRIKANIAHAQKVLDQLSKTKKVKVVITGGFHTYGFTKLLQDKNISYIVITPNVKQQTVSADVLYENIFKEQVSALYNTLQKMLASQLGAEKVLNRDVIDALNSNPDIAKNILNRLLETAEIKEQVESLEFQKDGKEVLIFLKDKPEPISISLDKDFSLTSEQENIINQSESKNEFEIFSQLTDIHREIREVKRKIYADNADIEEIEKLQEKFEKIKGNEDIKARYENEINKLTFEMDDIQIFKGTEEGSLTGKQIAQLKQDIKDINDFITNRQNLSSDKINEIENKIKQAQKKVSFGTAGHRGQMPGDFNPYIAFVIAAGSARAIKENDELKNNKVFISYDTRYMGKEYAQIMSLTFRALGIEVDITDIPTATPSISNWAKENSIYDMTFNITASHNPPLYNGIKPNNSDGSPALPEVTTKIQKNAQAGINENEKESLINYLEGNIKTSIKEANVIGMSENENGLNKVQDLHFENVKKKFAEALGVEVKDLENILEGLNIAVDFKNSALEPELVGMFKFLGINLAGSVNSGRDVIFGGKVNPEPNEENTGELKAEVEKLAKTNNNVFGIATDPDGDRFNIYYVNKNGDVEFLSPDEAGMIVQKIFLENKYNKLDKYLKSKPSNEKISKFLQENNYNIVTVRSADTTSQIDRLSEYYQNKMRDLVTGQLKNEITVSVKITDIGFKNLAEAAKEGVEPLMLLESSGGLVSGLYDKDGLTATLLPLLLLKNAGSSVEEELNEIEKNVKNSELLDRYAIEYEEDKVLDDGTKISANDQKTNFLNVTKNFETICKNIEEFTNYLSEKGIDIKDVKFSPDTDIENGIEIQFSNGNSLIVRASGTEPKIRIYTKVNAIREENKDKDEDKLNEENSALMALGKALVKNSGDGKYSNFVSQPSEQVEVKEPKKVASTSKQVEPTRSIEEIVYNTFKNLFSNKKEALIEFFEKRASSSMLLSPEINSVFAEIVYNRDLLNYLASLSEADVLKVLRGEKKLPKNISYIPGNEGKTELLSNSNIWNFDSVGYYISFLGLEGNVTIIVDDEKDGVKYNENVVTKENFQFDSIKDDGTIYIYHGSDNDFKNNLIKELSSLNKYSDNLYSLARDKFKETWADNIAEMIWMDEKMSISEEDIEKRMNETGESRIDAVWRLKKEAKKPIIEAIKAGEREDAVTKYMGFNFGLGKGIIDTELKSVVLEHYSIVTTLSDKDREIMEEFIKKFPKLITEIKEVTGEEYSLNIFSDILVALGKQIKGNLQLTTIKDNNGNDLLHFNVNENLREKDGFNKLKEDNPNVVKNPFESFDDLDITQAAKDTENIDKKETVTILYNNKANIADAQAFLSLSGVGNIEFVEREESDIEFLIELEQKGNFLNLENYSSERILAIAMLLAMTEQEAKELIEYINNLKNNSEFEKTVYQALYASEVSGTNVEKFNAYFPGADGLRNYLFKTFPNRNPVVTEGPQLQHSIGQSQMAARKSFNTYKKSKYSDTQYNQYSLPWYIIPMESQTVAEIGHGHFKEYSVNKNNHAIGVYPVERNAQFAAVMMTLFNSVGQAQNKKEKTDTKDVRNKYAKQIDNNVTERKKFSKITTKYGNVGVTLTAEDNSDIKKITNIFKEDSNLQKGHKTIIEGRANKGEGYKNYKGEEENERPAFHHLLEYCEFVGEKFDHTSEYDNLNEEQQAILDKHIETLNKMLNLFEKWEKDGITTIIFNGIGGSELGPRMIVEFLEAAGIKGKFDIRFVSSPSQEAFNNVTNGLDRDTTAIVGMSKSGTTRETVESMEKLLIWKSESKDFDKTQIAYVSDEDSAIKNSLSKIGIELEGSSKDENSEYGKYAATNKFGFDNSIGGRWSWISAIGMAVIAYNPEAFSDIVKGARNQSLKDNFNDISIALAALGIKGTQIDGNEIQYVKLTVNGKEQTFALPQFVEWLKQLQEESNGKGTDITGKILDEISSCESVEFTDGTKQNADLNIVIGKTGKVKIDSEVKYNLILEHDGSTAGMLNSFGALLNIFEQKVEADGIMRNVNSFDQPAVQDAKATASQISEQIKNAESDPADPQLDKFIEKYNPNAQLDLGFGKWAPVIESPMLFISLFVPAFRKNFIEMHNYSYENNIKGAYKDFFTRKTTNGTERDKRADIQEIGYGVNFVSIFTFAFSLFITTLVGIVLGNCALHNLINYILLFAGLSYPLSIAFHQIWNSFMEFLGTPEAKLSLGDKISKFFEKVYDNRIVVDQLPDPIVTNNILFNSLREEIKNTDLDNISLEEAQALSGKITNTLDRISRIQGRSGGVPVSGEELSSVEQELKDYKKEILDPKIKVLQKDDAQLNLGFGWPTIKEMPMFLVASFIPSTRNRFAEMHRYNYASIWDAYLDFFFGIERNKTPNLKPINMEGIRKGVSRVGNLTAISVVLMAIILAFTGSGDVIAHNLINYGILPDDLIVNVIKTVIGVVSVFFANGLAHKIWNKIHPEAPLDLSSQTLGNEDKLSLEKQADALLSMFFDVKYTYTDKEINEYKNIIKAYPEKDKIKFINSQIQQYEKYEEEKIGKGKNKRKDGVYAFLKQQKVKNFVDELNSILRYIENNKKERTMHKSKFKDTFFDNDGGARVDYDYDIKRLEVHIFRIRTMLKNENFENLNEQVAFLKEIISLDNLKSTGDLGEYERSINEFLAKYNSAEIQKDFDEYKIYNEIYEIDKKIKSSKNKSEKDILQLEKAFLEVELYALENQNKLDSDTIGDLKKLISIKSNILRMYEIVAEQNYSDSKMMYELTEANKLTEARKVKNIFNYLPDTVSLDEEYENAVAAIESNVILPNEIKKHFSNDGVIWNSVSNVEMSDFMAILRAIELYNTAQNDEDRENALKALKNMQEAIENRIKDIEEGKQKVDDKKLEDLEQYLAEIKNITESETDVRFTKDSTKENRLVRSLDNYINDETNNRVLRFGVRIAREFVVGILEVFDTFTIMFNPEKFLLEHNDYRMAVYKSAINTLYVQSKKYQEDLKDKNNDYERLTTLITLIPESEKETLKELKLLKNLLDTSNEKNFRKEFNIDEVQKAKETKDKMEKGARRVGVISSIALVVGAIITFSFAGLDVGALSNLVNLLLSMLAGTAASLGANAVVHAFWNIRHPDAKLTKDLSIDSRIISKVEDINKVNNEIDDQIDAKIKNLKEQKVKYEEQNNAIKVKAYNSTIEQLQEIQNLPFETKLERIAKYNIYETDKYIFDDEIVEATMQIYMNGSERKIVKIQPITINGQTVTDDMVNKIKEEIILLNKRKEKKPELPFTEKTLKVEGWTLRNVIGNIYKNDSFKTVEVDNALGELVKIEDIDYRNTGFKNYEDMCKKLTKLITNLPSEKNKINPIIKQIVEDNLINTKLAKQDLLQNLYSIYETEIIKLAKQAELLEQKRTLTDIYPEDLQGKTIGLVLDLNVPVMNGKITDYTRIDATLETIKYLTDRGAKVVAMSHHGRPKGWETEESLEIVAKGIEERAKEVLNYDLKVKFPKVSLKEQTYSNYLNSDVMKNTVEGMNNGNVLLLENLRFDDRYSGDNKADMAEQFVDKLGLDGVVFDAFGVSHRNNFIRDMIEKVNGKEIGALTGFLVEKELNEFAKVETPKHPFVAILGGSKVSDKIGVINNLLDKMQKGDTIVIGGAMAYTFLFEQGYKIGNSKIQYLEDENGNEILDENGNKIIDPKPLRLAREVLNNEKVKNKEVRILLPIDHVVSTDVDFKNQKVPENAIVKNTDKDKDEANIEDGFMGVDIGEDTVIEIQKVLENVGKNNGTIVWNGPSGIFEIDKFAQGTFAVARAVADASDRENGAFSMIGGGDSVAAANKAGVSERISHISTGGGASLNLLEGKSSPLIEVIPSKFQREVDEVNKRITKKEELLNGKVTNKGKIVYQKTKGERNMMKLLSRFIERGEFETSGESQTLLGRILHADGRKATEEELYISRAIRFIKQSSIEEMLAGFDNDNLAENIKTVDGFINDFKKNSVNFKPETSFERNYINTLSFDYFVEKWNEYKNTKAKNYSTDEIVSINFNNSNKKEIENFIYETALKLQQDNNWSDEGRKIFENYMFARIAQIKGDSSDELLNFNSFTPTAWKKEGVNFDGVIKNLDDLKDEKYTKEAKSVDVGVYLMNGGIGSSIEREDYLVSINWYKEQIEKINNPKTTQQEKREIEEQINKVFNNETSIKDILGNKYESYKSKVELAAKADDLYFKYKDENGNTRLISITELKNNSYSQQIKNDEFKTLKETILVSPDSLKPVKASIAGNPIMQKTLGLSTLMQEKYPVSRYNEETENFEILVGKNYPTAPGGHGVWFATIWNQIIGNSYTNGHISFVGNSDALAARPDQSVVGYMEKENVGIVMLAAEREASDAKGGIFGLFKNRLTLGEIAQFEAVKQEDVFEDVGLVEGDDAQAFNTNSIYTNDKLLKDLYIQLKEIGKNDADIEQMMQPDLIVNGKEKDGIGKYDQLEGALGASVLNFNLNLEKLRKENKDLDEWMNVRLGKNQPLVQVVMASKQDREKVFTPIKKAFDFWKQATNLVIVDGNKWLSKSPKGHGTVNVSVKNSKGQAKQNYKDVSYFMDNWTNDDISELDKLSVDGYNVKLQNLKLEGEVIIENETGEEFVISIENKKDLMNALGVSEEDFEKKYIKSYRDFEYNGKSDEVERTGTEREYLVLKDVKIIKKSDGSVAIENLNKGYTETVNAAKEQTTEIIKGANEWLQIQSLNIISLFKEKTEIVAVVDGNDKAAINEAIELSNKGIKVKLVMSKDDMLKNEKLANLIPTEETDNKVGDINNLSFELNAKIGNLEIVTYELINGQSIIDKTQLAKNALEVLSNKIKGKKVLYVSESIEGIEREEYEKAGVLACNSESIVSAMAEGIVAYKSENEILNSIDNSNGIIASYKLNDNITETDITNLIEQGISRVMIEIYNESMLKDAKDKAESIKKYDGIDVIIVDVNNKIVYDKNDYGIGETKFVLYSEAKASKDDLSNSIVYVDDSNNDVLNKDDIEKLNGVTLAVNAGILDAMNANGTEKDGVTLLDVIKVILKQNSPETKRNKAIIKGRRLVIGNKAGDIKAEDLIKDNKAVISNEQLKKIGITATTPEEKEGIALGIIQALELQKIDVNLLEQLNKNKISNSDELLMMLGMYKVKTGKSYVDIQDQDNVQSYNGESLNDTLNRLRENVKEDENDTAAIAGIIDILLANQLSILEDVDKLLNINDAKTIQAILSAA